MNSHASEQPLHDDVNLGRLVIRLEQSISDHYWKEVRGDTWIKAQGTLQVRSYIF